MRKLAFTCAVVVLLGCGFTDQAMTHGDGGGGVDGGHDAPSGDDATADHHAPPDDAANDHTSGDDATFDAPSDDSPSDDSGGDDATTCGMMNDPCSPNSGMKPCCANLGCHGDSKCGACVSSNCDDMGMPCCAPSVCKADKTCDVMCTAKDQTGCGAVMCCFGLFCVTDKCLACKPIGATCMGGNECCSGKCNPSQGCM